MIALAYLFARVRWRTDLHTKQQEFQKQQHMEEQQQQEWDR
jgi:hypothetical protein